ncbi:MAG TPA: ROK family protein [Saprospiraceae bacterium]|nr:ROK family protein [Saprospiraceae bacterium]
MKSPALGIDIGGSGIKAGFVDLDMGDLIGERIKIDTPQPSTPVAVATSIRDMLKDLDWKGEKIGCGFPAIIQDGVALSAANIDKSWIGVNVEELLQNYTGYKFYVINDADAAGMAERMFGRIKNVKGTVMLLTLGTGIGSALFYDGTLIPNTEFGHINYKGKIAEDWVSNRARKDRLLEYDEWADELAEFLDYLILLFSPRLFVLGGGISFRFDEFSDRFSHLRTPVVSASAFNDAGIIGAAVAAYPELMEPYM